MSGSNPKANSILSNNRCLKQTLEDNMKSTKLVCILVLLLMQFSFAQYQIKRGLISNGAGHVSGNSHQLKAAAGQPVTGVSSGGSYTIYAGFWYTDWLITSINDDIFNQVPAEFKLFQNYPNPFNPLTTIRFSLPEPGPVKLEIYTLLGRRVTTLLDEHKNPGTHEVKFDGDLISSGTYIYRIQAGNFGAVKKMVFA